MLHKNKISGDIYNKLLAEKRLVFEQATNKAGEFNEKDKEKRTIDEIEKKMTSDEKLSPEEKNFLKSNPNKFKQTDKLDKLLKKSDENLKGIIFNSDKKSLKNLNSDEEREELASTPINKALEMFGGNRKDRMKYIGFLTELVSQGNYPELAIMARNMVRKIITGDFIDSAKEKSEKEALANLRQFAKDAERVDMVKTRNEDAEGVNRTEDNINKILGAKEHKQTLVEKHKDALDLIEKKLGSKTSEALKIKLANENVSEQERQKEFATFVVSELSRRRQEILLKFNGDAVKEYFETRDFLLGNDSKKGLIEFVHFETPEAKAEIKQTLQNKLDSMEKQFAIVSESRKESLVGKKDFRKILLEKLVEARLVDETKEKIPAEVIISFADKLQNDADKLKKSVENCVNEMGVIYREYADKKTDDIGLSHKINELTLKYKINEEGKTFIKNEIKDAKGVIQPKKLTEFFAEVSNLSTKFGIDQSYIRDMTDSDKSIYEIVGVSSDNHDAKNFREKAFEDHFHATGNTGKAKEWAKKAEKIFKENPLLNDFFSIENKPLDIKCIERLFGDESDLEAEVIKMLLAPEKEEVLKDLHDAKVKTEAVEKEVDPRIMQALKERIRMLHRFANSKLLQKTKPEICAQAEKAREDVQSFLDKKEFKVGELPDINVVNDITDPSEKAHLDGIIGVIRNGIDSGVKDISVFERATSKLQGIENVLVTKNNPDEVEDLLKKANMDWTPLIEEVKEGTKSIKESKEVMQINQVVALKTTLLDWRFGKASDDELKTTLMNYENKPGDKALEIIPKTEWKYGENVAAHFEGQGQGKFKIFIREDIKNDTSKWAHELAHTMIYFGGKVEGKSTSKNMLERAEKELGLNFDQERKAFKDEMKKLGQKGNFAQEVFCQLFGEATTGQFEGMPGEAAKKISEKFQGNEQGLQEFLRNSFAKNFEKKVARKFGESFLNSWKNTGHHAIFSTGFEGPNKTNYDPIKDEKRVGLLMDQFNAKKETSEKRLKAIEESLTDVDGKEEFVSITRLNINTIEERLKSNPSEGSFLWAEEQMNDIVSKSTGALSVIAGAERHEGGFFKQTWNRTSFLSMADMKKGWTIYKDYVKRRHETRSKRRVGTAGGTMFNGINNKIAAEYDLQKESAEKEEVSKYQSSLVNKDVWEVYDRIERTTNQDELRAYLKELASRGKIKWRDKRIWDAFERVGAPVKFKESDTEDLTVLYAKMQKACGTLWDYDEFRNLEKTNLSSYDSKKSEYEREANALLNSIEAHLDKMLKDHCEGGKVDPIRYEKFIDQAVKYGKSSSDRLAWYLIQGVYVGLLTMERLTTIETEHQNRMPPLQMFGIAANPTKADIDKWAKMFPPQKDKGWSMPISFKEWTYSVMGNQRRVLERTAKSASDKLWDHDHMQGIGKIGNTKLAQQLTMIDANGNPQYHATAYPNMMDGQFEYLAHTALHRNEFSPVEYARIMARQMGYIANMNGILTNRTRKKENRTRFTPGERRSMPRSSIFTKNKYNVGKICDNVEQILGSPHELMAELMKKDPDIKTVHKILQSHPELLEKDDLPETIDQCYDNIEVYLERLFTGPNGKKALDRYQEAATNAWKEVQKAIDPTKPDLNTNRDFKWGKMEPVNPKAEKGYDKFWVEP